MKHIFLLILFASTLFAGVANACNHDILCPDQWVWSDAEGTCVEAETGTM